MKIVIIWLRLRRGMIYHLIHRIPSAILLSMRKPAKSKLDEIVAHKKREIGSLDVPPPHRDSPPRDFAAAFRAKPKYGIHLLAEIKRASPSAGDINVCEPEDIPAIAKAYERCGAAAISVLTDEKYFNGSLEHMIRTRETVSLPVLRKEFIIHPRQVYESYNAGADAILLMTQILHDEMLSLMLDVLKSLRMGALVEGHSEDEIRRAVDAGAHVIGINNRDLRTFETDIRTTERLIKLIPPDRIVVSQSAIKTRHDVRRIRDAGAHAIQIGETLMRSGNIEEKIEELFGS